MKKLKNLFIFGLCTTLITGTSVFASEGEKPDQQPPAAVELPATESDKNDHLIDLTEKYYNVVMENANLHTEHTNLITENLALKEEKLKLENENKQLKKDCDRYKRKMTHYKKKLEKKQNCVTNEELQSRVHSTIAEMVLEFAKYMGDYIKNNPRQKAKNINLDGLFKDFLTLNLNYTNNGDTNFSPLAIKGTAKAAVAGAGLAV